MIPAGSKPGYRFEDKNGADMIVIDVMPGGTYIIAPAPKDAPKATKAKKTETE